MEGNVSDEDAVTELSSEAEENPPEDTEEEMATVWHVDASATDEVIDSPVDEWIESVGFETTEEVPIPERLVDQVIGQNAASAVIRKAAEQRRHMMMIGDPGTGKSMLARSMTELLPKDTLVDVLCYPNEEDENERLRAAAAHRRTAKSRSARGAQRGGGGRRGDGGGWCAEVQCG